MSDDLEADKPLSFDRSQRVDPYGRALTLCVFHSLDQYANHVQASHVVFGVSVCTACMLKTVNAAVFGRSIAELLHTAANGELRVENGW